MEYSVSLAVQSQHPPHVLLLGPREEAHMLRRLLQGGNLRLTHLKALGSSAAATTLLVMQPDILLACCRDTNEVTRIRQLTSQLPLIVCSSIAEEAHIVRMLDAGADDYVLWGCGRGELQARLHRHIRRYWVMRVSEGEFSPSPGPLLLMESEDQHIRLLCEERSVLVRGQPVHHVMDARQAIPHVIEVVKHQVFGNLQQELHLLARLMGNPSWRICEEQPDTCACE